MEFVHFWNFYVNFLIYINYVKNGIKCFDVMFKCLSVDLGCIKFLWVLYGVIMAKLGNF